ncbi:hypothetical protein RFI_39190 [Reticulomyxa filosa]|uniref:Uncharacterized protein n=1 Tax=Reticulomyxa filosa TaxID=46433 RepID=X6LAD9_RETFI|nr:hypothetical protein RFI_39190 [Reticulomyxa filosa]|eukprot:ETN98320.1 hypothetical protein RFI_39190 [Reticulomyxa filosa]
MNEMEGGTEIAVAKKIDLGLGSERVKPGNKEKSSSNENIETETKGSENAHSANKGGSASHITYPELYYNYGLFCAEYLKDLKKAKTYVVKYLEHRPHDNNAHLLLRDIEQHLNR